MVDIFLHEVPNHSKMAAECIKAKTDISAVLRKINRKFEINDVSWTNNNRNFETKFRTQVDRHSEDFNKLCDEWVNLFGAASGTTWVETVSNTGVKTKFRKQYQCWTFDDVVKKELLFDKRKCSGKLGVKILSESPVTKKKCKQTCIGLNVVVKLDFCHHHECDTTQQNSFFVHNCKPLSELPQMSIPPNPDLTDLIAKVVKKGPIVSKMAAEKAAERLKKLPQDSGEAEDSKSKTQETIRIEYTGPIVADQQIQVTDNILLSQPLFINGYPQVIPISSIHAQYGIEVETQPQTEQQGENLQYL